MSVFVNKLMSNPSMGNLPIIQKENQILSFIKDNQAQLKVAFAQPEQFPRLAWEDAVRLLVSIVTDKVVAELEEIFGRALNSVISSNILGALDTNITGLLDPVKFQNLVRQSLRIKSMRDQFYGSFVLIEAHFLDRYLPVILGRRKTIYNELIRRDRLSIDPHLLPYYLGLAALFRPLYWHRTRPLSGIGNPMSLRELNKNQSSFQKGLEDLSTVLTQDIKGVPRDVLKVGIDSCLSFNDHPDASGASRLLAILVGRSVDYTPEQTVDKGAESADKSWFNIRRRTAKFYGFDSHFLDELYRIAGDEGW